MANTPNDSSSKSDTNIYEYLPEVFRSDINKVIFGQSFDRHLTGDNTRRVTGYAGQGTPCSIISRQIQEPTVQLQAFQLQPTMYTKVGDVEQVVSFKSFQKQLELMGVDFTQMQKWGNAQQFNWIPPINIDMFSNYVDYYWLPQNPADVPQYLTIENKCAKFQARVSSYAALIGTYGTTFPITGYDVFDNKIVLSGQLQYLFIPGALLYITNTSDPNIENTFFTVLETVYEQSSVTTTLTLAPSFAIRQPTPPVTTEVGRLWIDTDDDSLYRWDGLAWVPTTNPLPSGDVSIQEVYDLLIKAANCACSGSFGWDLSPWDDNGTDWTTYIAGISSATPPLAPTPQELWLDTTSDILYQRDLANVSWIPIATNFMANIFPTLTEETFWDLVTTCFDSLQIPNQWSDQNKWVQKTQVQSFAGVRRAQLPILEYDSRLQLSKWSRVAYNWKYRPGTTGSFSAVTTQPTRIELEPIKGYTVTNPAPGEWYIYLFDNQTPENKDTNYASTFAPGYIFKIRDDTLVLGIYTVESVQSREAVAGDPVSVQGMNLITIVKIAETTFTSPLTGGGVNNVRIEPSVTSLGDTWRGYHVHWVVDINSAQTAPAAPQTINPLLKRAIFPGSPTYAFTKQSALGFTNIGEYLQEITMGVSTATIPLDTSFRYSPVASFTTNAVVPGLGGSWTISGNYASFFPVGSMFFIDANVGDGEGIYTVASATDVGLDTVIVVNETIGALATPVSTIKTGMHSYALAGTNNVRVYVNNIRAYGTYTENVATGAPNYTAVGLTALPGYSFQYVESITFSTPLNVGDVVRLEIGPAAFSDMGMFSVPIRTIEDETAFAAAVATQTQPVYLNAETYQLTEQLKVDVNQYPLFDVFDVCTGELVKSSPIFAYAEHPDAPVNPNINLRIFRNDGSGDDLTPVGCDTSAFGRNFVFDQFLLDETNGQIYGYRLLDGRIPVNSYWFNPANNELKWWDGTTWQTTFIFDDGFGNLLIRTPFVGVAADVPTGLINLNGAVWYDTAVSAVKVSNGVTWNTVATATTPPTGLYVEQSDPTLTTIWRSVPQYEYNSYACPSDWTEGVYVPEWVDKDRQPLPVGDPLGDWEIPDQWRFNPEHENRQRVKYLELATHFRSIINAQPTTNAFIGGGTFAKTQAEYEYWRGGSIKEHNDSYDTLMSAVNVTNVTPPGVIDFAQDQYDSLFLTVQNLYLSNLIGMLTNFSEQAILNPGPIFAETVLDAYEGNDFYGQVFANTSAFDPTTGIGVRHWVASVPMFALGPKFRPHLSVDDKLGIYELTHHDGHRSTIQFSSYDQNNIAQQLVNVSDPRVTGQTVGKRSVTAPPSTRTAFELAMGQIRAGTYWYQLLGGAATLYRFTVVQVAGIAPTTTGLEDGTKYYNSLTNTLYELIGGVWTVVTAVGDGIIASAWEAMDLRAILAEVLLELENRLYAVTPTYQETAFDFSCLISDVADQAQYDLYEREQFYAYITENQIVAPFKNTGYQTTNPFTWNYANSNITIPPRSYLPLPTSAASSWQEAYTRWYGTPYPHLEPWVLQGFTDKPLWWDEEYLDLTGTRRWIYNYALDVGMWRNIRLGIIPVGRFAPNGNPGTGALGQAPKFGYVYFSVNISDSTITGGYDPDDLLPPFYSTLSINVRSLYSDFAAEIVAPSADYTFGSGGPVEWQWSVSGESVYDPLIIAFRMQPVRFMHYTFGPQFTIVNNLQVETTFCKVYSHRDVLFNGDIYDVNKQYLVRGLNQWYVNFNTYNNIDTNKEFRTEWATWDPLLTYQFAGIIDTSTLQVTNKYFDIIQNDYNVVLSNVGVIDDKWVDAFNVSVLYIPPSTIQYNSEGLWQLSMNSLSTVSRSMYYYDVKNYPFIVNLATNTATIFQYRIANALSTAKLFEIEGDHVADFAETTLFVVSGSTGNDGTYTVRAAVYNAGTNTTQITTLESVPSSVADGIIDIPARTLPWDTGQVVFITSTGMLPGGITQYDDFYIIKVNSRQFKIAATQNDALTSNPIILSTPGSGTLSVGEIDSSFRVFGGESPAEGLWYHYAIDYDRVRTFIPPYAIEGMQNLINIIDGYVKYQESLGIVYNDSTVYEQDPDTGRTVNWQLEQERFLDWAYRLRRTRMSVADRFAFTVTSTANDTLQFADTVPVWTAGTAVVLGTTGTLPLPLLVNRVYYYAPTGNAGEFQLSTTPIATVGSIVNITSTGSGTLFIAQKRNQVAFPTFEINPIANNVWIKTPLGILSDVIRGPYPDIRLAQTMFDQYGRQMTGDQVLIYRQDLISRISILPRQTNDLIPSPAGTTIDPYNFIHIGGAHLFIEGYEHVCLFNDYTTGNYLIYDPFLGITVQRIEFDYFETIDYTLRPTIGGYYLLDGQFYRNIEGSVNDLRNYYNTFTLNPDTEVARRARDLIGYGGRMEYLNLLNVGSQSQFMFYRGMIQAKGSVNSIKAYINSRRFIDAKIDEIWAWKIAEYGDTRPRVYPEFKLFASDGTLEDIRLEFLTETEATDTLITVPDERNGFKIITFKTLPRWVNLPEERTLLNNSIMFLDADVTMKTSYAVGLFVDLPTTEVIGIDFYYATDTDTMYKWFIEAGAWVAVSTPASPTNHKLVGTIIYLKMLTYAWNTNTSTWYVSGYEFGDTFRVVRRETTLPLNPLLRDYTITLLAPGGTGIDEFEIVNSEVIALDLQAFTGIVGAFVINQGNNKINPAKIINTIEQAVTTEVPYWHPARGQFYYIAAHNVNLQTAGDPATYLVTPNPNDVSDQPWDQAETGTVWLDTSGLGYTPYYDEQIFPDVNTRLFNWGRLADWGTIKVCEWVESKLTPVDWDNESQLQQNNTSIPTNAKISGNARQEWFRRERTPVIGSVVFTTPDGKGYQAVDYGAPITTSSSCLLANDATQGYQEIAFAVAVTGATAITWVTDAVPPYLASVVVDGTAVAVNVPAVATIGAVVTNLSNALSGKATVSVTGGRIRITSVSRGPNSTVQINDATLFVSIITTGGTVGDGAPVLPAVPGTTGTQYTATATIDGTTVNALSVYGYQLSFPTGTIGELITLLNAQMTGGSFAIDGNGDLRLTSNTPGPASTVLITNVNLFPTVLAAVAGDFGYVQVSASINVDDGDEVLFTTTGTFPTTATGEIEQGVKYITAFLSAPPGFKNFTLGLDTELGLQMVDLTTAGTGTLTVVPAFKDTDWVKKPLVSQHFVAAIDLPTLVGPTFTMDSQFAENDIVDVYVNGVLQSFGYTLDSSNQFTLDPSVIITLQDFVDVVRGEPPEQLTTQFQVFDPDVSDDGTINQQYRQQYEYSFRTVFENNIAQLRYYFWVENTINRDVNDPLDLPLVQVVQQLETIPIPYMVVQKPVDDPNLQDLYGYGIPPYGTVYSLPWIYDQYDIIPVFYRQAIIRKASPIVNVSDQYVIRFTRDLTLRDNLDNGATPLDLKAKHEEWLAIRREQLSSIDRVLWNALTEALIGYKLDDPTIAVPSLERVLYDEIAGTDSRYGLGEGQAFTNKEISLNTVIAYLTNPDISFYPIDINNFFATYSFDTPQNIAAAMNAIYNTFAITHVNNIWFNCLEDAFSVKAKYREFFKTSWVALFGVRILEVGGLFDD